MRPPAPLDPDIPQWMDFDPFTAFLENEASVCHLRLLGTSEESLRQIRQEMDESLMALHAFYREQGVREGRNPWQLYGWGTESFYSATSPF